MFLFLAKHRVRIVEHSLKHIFNIMLIIIVLSWTFITPYVTYVVYSIVPHFQLSSRQYCHNIAVGLAMLKDILIVFITGVAVMTGENIFQVDTV